MAGTLSPCSAEDLGSKVPTLATDLSSGDIITGMQSFVSFSFVQLRYNDC